MTVYTVGIWRVRAGREDEFAAAWRKLAEDTQVDHPGATALLLRDRDHPGLFISSGPWDSPDQVEQWRSSSAFTDNIAEIRECLEGFEPHTMDPVATVEPRGA